MNRVKSVMLLTLLSLILMAIGGVVGGQNGAMTMFLISLAINFYTYWNSDKMALRAYNAQPLSESQVPELYELVRELCRKAELPMPRLYVIPTDVPNAFATGRDPEHAAVAVTEGILSMLNRDELAGVISHELSHVKHRDTLIMTLSASIATAISYIANIAQWAAIFGTARSPSSWPSSSRRLQLLSSSSPCRVPANTWRMLQVQGSAGSLWLLPAHS